MATISGSLAILAPYVAGVGFLTIIPLAVASLAGGLLYEWNSASPWGFVLVVSAIALVLTAVFVRDPKNAEI